MAIVVCNGTMLVLLQLTDAGRILSEWW